MAMMSKPVDDRRGARYALECAPTWRQFSKKVFECRVLLCPEEGGGYSAHALRIPGVVSQGETQEEALENIREAFRGAILAYQEEAVEIPWGHADVDRPKDSVERWILVDV